MSLMLLPNVESNPGIVSVSRSRLTCRRTDIGLYAGPAVLEQHTLAGQCLCWNWTWLEVGLEQVHYEINLISNVPGSLGPVFNNRVMFGPVVCIIVDSFVPKDLELLLSLAVSEPIIPHIP